MWLLLNRFYLPVRKKITFAFFVFDHQMNPSTWQVGDRVQVNFEEGGKYYSGIVLKVITKKGHATEYLIEYDDGDCEYTISQVMLIFLGLFSGD